VEFHLISELLPLFLGHGLIGLYHALVKTGDLHIIIEVAIDKFQAVHSRNDLFSWEVYLKKNIKELGERIAVIEFIRRDSLLTQVYISYC
jgi:hypothetical protein